MNLRRTTQQLVDGLFARINYERQHKPAPDDFKLANMLQFLKQLGNPHLACPVIHVAGTKGKGSVSAMVGSILAASGFKTGVYSSPHLERINQRIRINGEEISDTTLYQALAKLTPTIDDFDSDAEKNDSKKLTFFEVITAAACQVFADEHADAVVLEVGMGGRLDSTNVCQPVVSVVTNISLDHTRQLGNTVDKIAFEKAGIIKPGIPVISGVTDPAAAEVIRKVAADNDSQLIELDRDFYCRTGEAANQFSFQSDERNIQNIELTMFGSHQKINATLAIAVAELLKQQGWDICDDNVRVGLKSATLAGRCEVFDGSCPVIMDMAHNPASMLALAATLEQDVSQFNTAGKKTMIVAVSREKDLTAMLQPVIDLFDSFVVTRYVDNPRARSCDEIENCLRDLLSKSGKSTKHIAVIEDPLAAWEFAIAGGNHDHAICITGSVFLVAELRPIVLKWANNR